MRTAAASVIPKNGMKELGKMFLRIGQALEDEENGTRSGHTVPEKMAKKLERKIMAESSIVQGMAESYRLSRNKSKKRIEILSNFSRNFTLKELNQLVFKDTLKISPLSKRIADEHADRFGPGRTSTDIIKNKRRRIEDGLDEDIDFCMSVILAYVGSHAFGTRLVGKLY
jgi:hypothetical protein